MPKERITDVKVHPAASMFPYMTDKELERLADRIMANGQREACVFYKGEMIDGRNRWLVCKRLGIKPKRRTATKDEIGASVIDWIVDHNESRRQMTTSQRAMLATELTPLYTKEAKQRQKSGKTGDNGAAGDSRDKAGKKMNVSGRTVDWARLVKDKGSTRLKAAVNAGKVAVSLAGKLANCCDKVTQDRMLRDGSNAMRSEIGRHAEAGTADEKYLNRRDAKPPTEYVDDKGKKVPEELHVVWDQARYLDDQCKALRGAVKELRAINKVLQLTDIDEIVKSVGAQTKTLATMKPTRLDAAHLWITKAEI